MRCNQVSISIERFGEFVPKNYPADVQRIQVYCDDFNSIYAALSKAYAMAINELGEYERVGVRTNVSTNEFSRDDYRNMHGTVVSGKRSYEEDTNLEYRDSRMELLKDLIWVYEHSEEIINLIQQSEDMDHVSVKLKEQYGLNDYQIKKLSQIRMDMLTKEDYQRTREELEKLNTTRNNQSRNQAYIRSERRRLQFEIRKLETYFKAAEHCEEIMKLFLETEDTKEYENSMKERFGFERDESRLIRYFSINDFSLRKREEKRKKLESLKERLEYMEDES